MTAQVLAQALDRTLTAYRIGDPDGAYPIFSAKGASLHPGRWNTVDTPVIYASEHCATAMLERLAAQGAVPADQHYVEVTIDAGCSYEVFSAAHHPGWQDQSRTVSRAFGSSWRHEARSAILFVPSIVARMERNIVINPDHPDFARIHPGLHQPLWWDERLFG